MLDCFNEDPFCFREVDNREVVESLEAKEREEDRGLKAGLWEPGVGPKLLVLLGAGEYDRFDDGRFPEGVGFDDSRSSHMLSPQGYWKPTLCLFGDVE
jgi:hypothetical protein